MFQEEPKADKIAKCFYSNIFLQKSSWTGVTKTNSAIIMNKQNSNFETFFLIFPVYWSQSMWYVYYIRKTIPDIIIVIEYLQTYDLCVEKWKSLTFYLLLFFSPRLSRRLKLNLFGVTQIFYRALDLLESLLNNIQRLQLVIKEN